RVIKYVDKSKRVAVQTEASTIYNAAEAAYNDGKLDAASGQTDSKDKFDKIKVSDAVSTLKDEDLLSNTDTKKLGNIATQGTLGDLKALSSEDQEKIQIDNTGAYSGPVPVVATK
ncbi:MAG: hypothetical protein E6789_11595, partial [Clostridium baratii]|nr:hypothetical protein [Clostridium baratii]